jgi:predicted alpha/beta superfamily hydrolase
MKTSKHLFGMIALGMSILFAGIVAKAQERAVIKQQITSKHTGKTYELQVLLPANYSASDTTRYPVLYLLDGRYSFPLFRSIKQSMELGTEIRDLVIVGIDVSGITKEDWLISRHEDYTPTHQPSSDTLWSRMLNIPVGRLRSGGADKFLEALQSEIIPLIENNYRISKERGLYGHSLGGLFTSYCLLKIPQLFNRYSINSPSIWWNLNMLLQMETTLAKQVARIDARVFFSAGGYEGDMMLRPFKTFCKAISEHPYKNLEITVRMFEEETHLSVVPSCSSKTLKLLYPVSDK